MKLNNLTGKKFGKMTVIERDTNGNKHNVHWICICDCGNKRSVTGHQLKSGKTKTCGCGKVERASKLNYKHGKTGSTEYNSWRAMKGRCFDKNNDKYEYYGGKGITICESWSNFETFYNDMGKKPSPKHSLDRIDPNKNYEPNNCVWSDSIKQATNKKVSFVIAQCTRDGILVAEYPSQAEASRQTGISRQNIQRAQKTGINAGGYKWKRV